MPGGWRQGLLISAAAVSLAIAGRAGSPPGDRVARLNHALADHERSLHRDARTGYLVSVLDALGVPAESQLLVFSKTGVQRAYTSPHTPRALYFDQAVAIAYVPGAPLIEVAAHDPQQGVVFYTLDQTAAAPSFTRQTSCLSCHVSPGTLGVPGLIARSHTVGDDGNVRPQTVAHDVNHQTRHPDRWGGWFVTSEGAPPPYQQLAHLGNVTFSGKGNTSNQVFVDWMTSEPETRGYLSAASDIAGLLLFDHQVHAINLMTKLNVEARADSTQVPRLANELADYLLFANEAGPLSPLTPRPGFAASLAARVPTDRRGRSFAQLDMDARLLRYPCSYMIYSDAFEGLPVPVRQAVYRRLIAALTADEPLATRARLDERRAVLEILAETKPDFPATRLTR